MDRPDPPTTTYRRFCFGGRYLVKSCSSPSNFFQRLRSCSSVQGSPESLRASGGSEVRLRLRRYSHDTIVTTTHDKMVVIGQKRAIVNSSHLPAWSALVGGTPERRRDRLMQKEVDEHRGGETLNVLLVALVASREKERERERACDARRRNNLTRSVSWTKQW
jgi:hypothetical protein